MKIKLIASDIDGTILNHEGKVSERTKKIVNSLSEHGIEFALATGRSYGGAFEVAEQFEFGDKRFGMICLNGLETHYFPGERKKEHVSLSYQDCEKLQEIGESFFMGIMYCFQNMIYFQMDDLSYEDYMIAMGDDSKKYFNNRVGMEPVNSLNDIKHLFETDNILKIAYIQSPQYMDLVIDRIRNQAGSGFELMRVGPGWTEVMPDGINKGVAVLEYAAELGISPEEIAVFGDSENDLSMMKVAGTAVAVANAMTNVQEVSTHRTLRHDEDGVAAFIEDYLRTTVDQ